MLEQLNLTWEVRDGVRAHSWKIDPPPATPRGRVRALRRPDRLPLHDALDAMRAGVLRPDDLPARARAVFGEPGSEMVGAMIDAVVEGSLSPANTAGAVVMAPGPLEAMHELRAFMFERVYKSDDRRRAEARGDRGDPAAGRPPPRPPRADPGHATGTPRPTRSPRSSTTCPG